MFHDSRLILSAEQTVANDSADEYTTISTNVIDLGATPTLRSLSFEGMSLRITTSEISFTGATTATMEISLESDSLAGLNSGYATIHWSSGDLIGNDQSTGLFAVVPLPTKANYQRYLGLRFTYSNPAADGALMSAVVSAHLVPVADIHTAYPAGSQ